MILNVILLCVLILINGVFSASELAFLSLDKFNLNKDIEKGNKKAFKVKKLIDNPSNFLSTIQVAITLAGFLASAFAADVFADYFMEFISIDILSYSTLRTILVVIITIVLSYFTLVFGELVPKKIAINYPTQISYTFVDIIRFVMFCCYPLIKILTFSTNLVCKIFKIKDKDDKLTEEDIKKMILLGTYEGIVEEKEKNYMFNIFQFNDTEVEKVMTPFNDVVLLNIDDDIMKNMAIIKKTKYTRFPVYQGNTNNVIGVINVKDLIMQYSKGKKLNFRDILRPISKFSKTDKIDDVFRCMQENREGISIVVDIDKFLGIVTLEDAIEEIVGNIYDEHDK